MKSNNVLLQAMSLAFGLMLPFMAIGQEASTPLQLADSTTRQLADSSARLYKGYRLSVGPELYDLKSDRKGFSNGALSMFGMTAGVYVATKRVFASTSLGLYYSSESMAHTIDILKTNVTGGVYLLRTGNKKMHTFEPYITVAFNASRSTIFGSKTDINPNVPSDEKLNYVADDRPLGAMYSVQALGGLGVEFQLTNENSDFLHFFAEVQYGTQLAHGTNNPYFSKTYLAVPMAASLGVMFGKFRNR